jgi:hypothetical protein
VSGNVVHHQYHHCVPTSVGTAVRQNCYATGNHTYTEIDPVYSEIESSRGMGPGSPMSSTHYQSSSDYLESRAVCATRITAAGIHHHNCYPTPSVAPVPATIKTIEECAAVKGYLLTNPAMHHQHQHQQMQNRQFCCESKPLMFSDRQQYLSHATDDLKSLAYPVERNLLPIHLTSH